METQPIAERAWVSETYNRAAQIAKRMAQVRRHWLLIRRVRGRERERDEREREAIWHRSNPVTTEKCWFFFTASASLSRLITMVLNNHGAVGPSSQSLKIPVVQSLRGAKNRILLHQARRVPSWGPAGSMSNFFTLSCSPLGRARARK